MIVPSQKMRELDQRRKLLLARIALQRVRVELELHNLEQPIRMVDRGFAVVHYLKEHPLLVAAGVAALTVVGRRRVAVWVGRGWVAWRSLSSLSGLIRTLASSK